MREMLRYTVWPYFYFCLRKRPLLFTEYVLFQNCFFIILQSVFSISFFFQTSGLFKIDPKTGEVSTALPLTGKGRQVGSFSLPITKFLPRKDFKMETEIKYYIVLPVIYRSNLSYISHSLKLSKFVLVT
jgi:hypothetical protein